MAGIYYAVRLRRETGDWYLQQCMDHFASSRIAARLFSSWDDAARESRFYGGAHAIEVYRYDDGRIISIDECQDIPEHADAWKAFTRNDPDAQTN
jgi:hypothetical protein